MGVPIRNGETNEQSLLFCSPTKQKKCSRIFLFADGQAKAMLRFCFNFSVCRRAEDSLCFRFPIAYGHAHTLWGNENRAIDASIGLADPSLQKVKLEYKRHSEGRILLGTVGHSYDSLSQLTLCVHLRE